MESAYAFLESIPSGINKYMYLRNLQLEQPAVFYQLLLAYTEQILPYVYTPTVGEACQRYNELNLQTFGLYLNIRDHRGKILEMLKSWPNQNVRVIVVTDSERILGLGDLGTGGMGISEGKILLYTAAAGVSPYETLPICLDVGTNNKEVRSKPSYKGLKQDRATGEEYYAFIDEFMKALRDWKPHLCLQFEDFANHTAFKLLEKYQMQQCCFNDDIQGTACIALAGMLAAVRLQKGELKSKKIMFMGAGEAGVGIADLITNYLVMKFKLSREQARQRCFFVDSKGLVVKSRLSSLQEHKKAYAHDVKYQENLLAAIKQVKPDILVGVSTVKGAFDEQVFKAMVEYNKRPIIFPLSNPLSKSEATFEDAMKFTDGRVIFASGSPYDPIEWNGKTYYPAQANNAYVFPAVGYAAVLVNCRSIPDDLFSQTAEILAGLTTQEQLDQGFLFPPFSDIVEISVKIMTQLTKVMVQKGLGKAPPGTKWEAFVRSNLWKPTRPERIHPNLAKYFGSANM